MNIDSRLTNFQTSVSPQLTAMVSSKDNLVTDIENLKKINDSFHSSLKAAFKGDGADSVTPEIEYLNQTTTKIQQSLESEMTTVLDKCKTLDTGINNLKNILQRYNDALSRYNSMDDKDDNKHSAYQEVENLKREFEREQTKLISQHDEIMNYDSSVTILNDFGKADTSTSLNGFTAEYNGTEFASIYYHKDGVVYQKVVPICKDGQMAPLKQTYTIIYNTQNILASAGDTEETQALFSFLNAKLTNSTNDAFLWDYSAKKYNKSTSENVGKIMNQILQDTYKANNAKTVSDYAALAAMVANNSAVHFGYGGNSNQCTYGYVDVLKGGGKLDCIGFVRWCYSQGIYNAGVIGPNESAGKLIGQGGTMSPLNLLAHHSLKIKDMNMTERANIAIGSVLSRPCYDGAGNINNYHVGVVIGHTTDAQGRPAIVVAQSSNTTIGANNRVYLLEDLATDKGTWTNVSTPEMMTTRVTQGSFQGKTWVA